MIEKAVLFACFVGMTCGFAMDLSGRITKPTCVDIPSDLALCQNIGYNQMRMPNLLDHDSIFEVKDQSQGWIPLLIVNCDNDTQLFLCSLFSPVCLDRPIYPCRSLCRKVRQNCEPIMLKNCFPWPSMLECDLFPEDNGLCIQSEMRQKNTTDQPTMSSSLPTDANALAPTGYPMVSKDRPMKAVGSLFTQCHEDATSSSIVEYFCNADFVLKMKLIDVKESAEGKKYIGDPDKYNVIKQGSMKQKDLNKMTFWTREGANCGCGMLQPGKDNFLVMGHRDGKKLFMTYVHIWTKTKQFRNATRYFDHPCPSDNTEDPEDSSEVAATSKPKKGKKDRTGKKDRPGRDGKREETGTQASGVRGTDEAVTEPTKRKPTREERRLERERERERKKEGRRDKGRE
ncbi:secreted frizzled-related protein 5-like isoform X2 [Asterias rubens]|uniref:secreted frizzled-related protein 5-like isoform X2 n=1 Tax=Asterias rubens TaxID=7604 RepID=UPI001455D2D6|nr:secreted frizzled-related protein 5-like isoform X2 [Asterias rubens]